jgi:hypothetical protein
MILLIIFNFNLKYLIKLFSINSQISYSSADYSGYASLLFICFCCIDFELLAVSTTLSHPPCCVGY